MAARYSDAQIEDYETNRTLWLNRADSLLTRVLIRPFQNQRAGEYARTGLGRSLGYLEHAMSRFADVYPPNIKNASRNRERDAELLLQAFVMNVFGAIDNLAWIWVLERGVLGPGNRALRPAEMVFVGPRAQHVFRSLTPLLQSEINNSVEWFRGLGAYRHGVAHQIPIYIPRLFSDADIAEYRRLEIATIAAFDDDNLDLVWKLTDEKHRIGAYGAMMALNGEERPILLHPQLVCDLATVVNLGEILFAELDRLID